jgi:hypothetical protein
VSDNIHVLSPDPQASFVDLRACVVVVNETSTTGASPGSIVKGKECRGADLTRTVTTLAGQADNGGVGAGVTFTTGAGLQFRFF